MRASCACCSCQLLHSDECARALLLLRMPAVPGPRTKQPWQRLGPGVPLTFCVRKALAMHVLLDLRSAGLHQLARQRTVHEATAQARKRVRPRKISSLWPCMASCNHVRLAPRPAGLTVADRACAATNDVACCTASKHSYADARNRLAQQAHRRRCEGTRNGSKLCRLRCSSACCLRDANLRPLRICVRMAHAEHAADGCKRRAIVGLQQQSPRHLGCWCNTVARCCRQPCQHARALAAAYFVLRTDPLDRDVRT